MTEQRHCSLPSSVQASRKKSMVDKCTLWGDSLASYSAFSAKGDKRTIINGNIAIMIACYSFEDSESTQGGLFLLDSFFLLSLFPFPFPFLAGLSRSFGLPQQLLMHRESHCPYASSISILANSTWKSSYNRSDGVLSL